MNYVAILLGVFWIIITIVWLLMGMWDKKKLDAAEVLSSILLIFTGVVLMILGAKIMGRF